MKCTFNTIKWNQKTKPCTLKGRYVTITEAITTRAKPVYKIQIQFIVLRRIIISRIITQRWPERSTLSKIKGNFVYCVRRCATIYLYTVHFPYFRCQARAPFEAMRIELKTPDTLGESHTGEACTTDNPYCFLFFSSPVCPARSFRRALVQIRR